MMKLKPLIYAILLVCTLLFSLYLTGGNGVARQEPLPPQIELTPEEAEWLRSHPVITVTNELDWPPFDYVENGQPAGYSIELLDLIARQMGVRFQYINGLTWDELWTAFTNKEIELVHSIYYLESRTQYASYGKPYFFDYVAIFAQPDFRINSLDELAGKRGVITKGSATEEIIRKNIQNPQILEVDSFVDMFRWVESGKADYTMGSFASAHYHLKELGIENVKAVFFPQFKNYDANTSSLHIASHIDNPILIQIVQKALDSISVEEIRSLRSKWFGAEPFDFERADKTVDFSAEAQRYLAQRGIIQRCALTDWEPIEWRDQRRQDRGIAADITDLVAQRIGRPIETIAVQNWSETLAALEAHRCDLVAAIDPLDEKNPALRATNFYQKLDVVIATQGQQLYIQNMATLAGKKVGVVQDSIYQRILAENYPDIERVVVQDLKTGLRQVRDGKIVGIVSDFVSLAYFIQEMGIVNVKISGRFPEKVALQMGVRQDDEQLFQIISQALNSISLQTRQDLLNQWIVVKYEQGIDYGLLWRWFAVGGVIVLGIFYWNRQLAAANAQIRQLNDRLAVENLRMGSELDVARRMQQMILPKHAELAAIASLDLSVHMTVAEEVGGDYYDVLIEDGVVTIGIGDVVGHGLESGLVMLMTQTAVRTLKELREADPVRFLNTINAILYKNLQRMGIDRTMTLAIVTYAAGHLSITGQHETMLLVRANGQLVQIDTLDLGMIVGLVDDIAEFVGQVMVELQPGDGIVLYTDGIVEAKNQQGEFYGLERLCTVVQRNWSQAAAGVQGAAIADFRAFVGQQKVVDDITLLVLKQQ
ncbi:MAG: transporter substrate-binding domain-containing protein [Spirulina sp. SIO3F2]|nr:transporter substrate-binding domain-containing protein [Spirulina sp. SIO3F2]